MFDFHEASYKIDYKDLYEKHQIYSDAGNVTEIRYSAVAWPPFDE